MKNKRRDKPLTSEYVPWVVLGSIDIGCNYSAHTRHTVLECEANCTFALPFEIVREPVVFHLFLSPQSLVGKAHQQITEGIAGNIPIPQRYVPKYFTPAEALESSIAYPTRAIACRPTTKGKRSFILSEKWPTANIVIPFKSSAARLEGY